MVNIPVDINWVGWVGKIAYWAAYIFMGLIMAVVLYAGFMLTTYNIKADVFQVYGSGKDGVLSITKRKKNRLKWIKEKTAWKPLFPLFNRKEIEPFDSEYVYPGKQIYAFEFNDCWAPGRININHEEGQFRGEVNPVPYYVRNWQSLQHKKNAAEFAKNNFWEQNKFLVYGVVTVFICCALAAGTVYLTYEFATGGQNSMNALTQAINNYGTIPASTR